MGPWFYEVRSAIQTQVALFVIGIDLPGAVPLVAEDSRVWSKGTTTLSRLEYFAHPGD